MIRTVSEGFSNPGALPPITIGEEGVLEWLITRGKVKSTWHRDMKGVQAALAEASGVLRSSLPSDHPALAILDKHEDDIRAVGTSAEHSEKSVYFDVVVPVMAELLKTESQRTTLFRQYTSPSLRSWDALTRLYSQENLHLAEMGNEMLAAIKYELPSLRRSLSSAAKERSDINGKIDRAADVAKKGLGSYNRVCAEWGISPLGLGTARPQLEALCGALCADYEAVLESVFGGESLVVRAAERYAAFVRYGNESADVVPAVMAVAESVRTSASVKDALALACKVSHSSLATVTERIRAYKDARACACGDGTIELVEVGSENGPNSKESKEGSEKGCELELEKEGEMNIVEAFLWDSAWRQAFGNDLWELREFYTQMLVNTSSRSKGNGRSNDGNGGDNEGEGVFSLEMLGGSNSDGGVLPPSVGSQEEIRAFVDAITKAITAFETKKLQRVLEIRESGCFLDRASKAIEDNLVQSNAAEDRRRMLEAERDELDARSVRTEAAIAELLCRLGAMRELVSKEISKILNGREVTVKPHN